MNLKYLFYITCFLITTSLSAQTQWHRTYNLIPGDTIQVLDATLGADGSYYSLGAFADNDLIESLVVSKYNGKGDVDWSRKLFSNDSIPFVIGALTQLNDTLYVAGSIQSETDNKLLFSMSSEGLLIKTQYFSHGEDLNIQGVVSIDKVGENLVYGSSTFTNGEIRANVCQIDTEGSILWERNFINANDNGNRPTDILATQVQSDTTIAVLGRTENNNGGAGMYISKLDSMGGEIWSREYNYVTAPTNLFSLLSTATVTDTTMVAVGGIINTNTFVIDGIITYLDEMGDEVWTKQLTFRDFTLTALTSVTVNADGLINVYGEYIDANSGLTMAFTVQLDQNGELVKYTEYPGTAVLVVTQLPIPMIPTTDSGYAVWSSSTDETIKPNFMRLSPELTTPCSQELPANLLTDISLEVLPIEWNVSKTYSLLDSIGTIRSYELMAPTLALRDTSYCPNDPIMKTFDASQDEAGSYLWSTGDTTPTITVTEEGMFMVTVTMVEDVCYTLCDTVMIDRLPLPMVSINDSDVEFCETGEIILSLIYQGVGDTPQSIEWSTGETSSNIRIDAIGTYGVTIIDDCGEVADASIEINQLPNINGDLEITAQEIDSCENRVIQLSPMYIGRTAISYLWSTGETDEVILINEAGTYSVTVTNDCGVEDIASIDINNIIDEVQWPYAFFPSTAQVSRNRTFGPEVGCPNLLTDYEFKIFNRWGNNVFTSTNPEDRWNGEYKDKPQPGEVYVWYATYMYQGQQVTDKGDVTLIR